MGSRASVRGWVVQNAQGWPGTYAALLLCDVEDGRLEKVADAAVGLGQLLERLEVGLDLGQRVLLLGRLVERHRVPAVQPAQVERLLASERRRVSASKSGKTKDPQGRVGMLCRPSRFHLALVLLPLSLPPTRAHALSPCLSRAVLPCPLRSCCARSLSVPACQHAPRRLPVLPETAPPCSPAAVRGRNPERTNVAVSRLKSIGFARWKSRLDRAEKTASAAQRARTPIHPVHKPTHAQTPRAFLKRPSRASINEKRGTTPATPEMHAENVVRTRATRRIRISSRARPSSSASPPARGWTTRPTPRIHQREKRNFDSRRESTPEMHAENVVRTRAARRIRISRRAQPSSSASP